MSRFAIHIELPKIQHALEDPERWNANWERLMSTQDLNFILGYSLNNLVQRRRTTAAPESTDEYSINLNNAIEMRQRLGQIGIFTFIDMDFEATWMNAAPSERRKHVLVGLSEGCSIARNLNDARRFTADVLKLDYLSRDGKTYLDLFKTIMPGSDPDTTPDIYYIPNPGWDSFQERMKEKYATSKVHLVSLGEMQVLRTELIYYVVGYTMMSFIGHKIDRVAGIKPRGASSDHKTAQAKKMYKEGDRIQKMMFGLEEAKRRKDEEKQVAKALIARRVVMCFQCQKHQPEGERFSRCSRCWNNLKRDVVYCSRECQIVDYKKSHKMICGKEVDMDVATQFASKRAAAEYPTTPQQIPPAVAGFKRSLYLLRHVQLLNKNPKADFFFRIAYTGDTTSDFISMDLTNPYMHKVLRSVRNKAMSTGDRESIVALSHGTLWYCNASSFDKKFGWNFDDFCDQMAKEWEMPNLKEAILELDRKRFEDPLNQKRPQLFMTEEIPETVWADFVKIATSGDFDFERRLFS
ncbi:hypothetical protein F5879DRAFT_970975 [Lentinula edodes]|uniref:MYND-type domain-containing protein n=1 Tax=Lentinula edodes TaxID=5353 RepID=A0A1Q3ENN2_LENED|nr:hypothetical protein F5879DRAFT_970975 [Lentinula edodes]GAW08819.1 hypothetical protein LENED_010911 [Lentinula edodes]